MKVYDGGNRSERNSTRPKSAAQFLEDLLASFKGTGGGGGGDDSGGSGSSGPSASGRFVWIVLAVIFLVYGAWSSFYTVDVSEEGVVTRFGKYTATTPPGLHVKMPFGIDQVFKVKSKLRLQLEFGFRSMGSDGGRTTYSKQDLAQESLMLTGDLNVADVEWILQYEIADPWKYLFHARNVEQNIRDVSMSIMRRVVGDRLVGDVLTVGRVEIADEAKRLTQEVLDRYDMGIKVVTIILQDVNPPDEVKPAFNEINAAKQEQEQAINNAERDYNKVIPEARGNAEKLMSDAQAYAIDKLNRAKGDSAKFNAIMSEYRKAPELTRKRLYLDAMEDVLARAQKVTIIDHELKGVLPVLGGLGGTSGGNLRTAEAPKTGGNP